jgi:hypothetical protein
VCASGADPHRDQAPKGIILGMALFNVQTQSIKTCKFPVSGIRGEEEE